MPLTLNRPSVTTVPLSCFFTVLSALSWAMPLTSSIHPSNLPDFPPFLLPVSSATF